MSTIEQAVETVPAEPPTPERAQVLAGHARLLMMLGRHEHARQRSQEALAVARLAGARAAEANALNTLGAACAGLGHTEAGVTYLEQARTVAEEIGDADELCRAYNNQIGMLNDLGRSTEAVNVGLEGCRIARGFGLMRAHMLIGVAETLSWTGHWAEADQLFDELFERRCRPRIVSGRCYAGPKGSCGAAILRRREPTSRKSHPARRPHWSAVGGRNASPSRPGGGHRPQFADARQAVKDGLAALSGATDPRSSPSCAPSVWPPRQRSPNKPAPSATWSNTKTPCDAPLHCSRWSILWSARWGSYARHSSRLRSLLPKPNGPASPASVTRAAGTTPPGVGPTRRALRAAYARWRQAEALLAVGAPRSEAAAVASASWKAASDLGARRLTAESGIPRPPRPHLGTERANRI